MKNIIATLKLIKALHEHPECGAGIGDGQIEVVKLSPKALEQLNKAIDDAQDVKLLLDLHEDRKAGLTPSYVTPGY